MKLKLCNVLFLTEKQLAHYFKGFDDSVFLYLLYSLPWHLCCHFTFSFSISWEKKAVVNLRDTDSTSCSSRQSNFNSVLTLS